MKYLAYLRGTRELRSGGRAWTLVAVAGPILAGCSAGFEAVSVYPHIVYDDASEQITIYGHGFEGNVSVEVSWLDAASGQPKNAALTDVEVIDAYTLRATLPDLAGQVEYPLYPYREFIDYTGDVTAGLYDCATGEPVIWDLVTLTGYCDAAGTRLSFVGPNPDRWLVPPGPDDVSALDYAGWYEYLYYCALNNDPSSTVLTEEAFALLIPDYGLGCFFPDDPAAGYGGTDETGRPRTYTYCPLRIPAAEVNITVSMSDGSVSEITGGLTLLDWTRDYYFNGDYGTRVYGFYGPYRSMSTGTSPVAAAFADLTADGYVDTAAVDPVDNTVTIVSGPVFLIGDTETTYTEVVAPATARGMVDVAAGDFDGDGIQDLVTANGASLNLSVYLGQVNRDDPDHPYVEHSTEALIPLRLPGGDVEPSAVITSDLNEDGLLDLLVASESSRGLLTLLQVGDGQFAAPVFTSVAEGPSRIAVQKLNGDSYLDVVAVCPGSQTVVVLVGNTQGTLSRSDTLVLGTTPGALATSHGLDETESNWVTRLEDFNNDSFADLVVADGEAPRLLFFAGTAGGQFGDPVSIAIDGSATALTIADANSDGRPDLVTGTQDGTGQVLLNEDSGSAVEFSSLVTLDYGGIPTAMVAPDREWDGDNDLGVVITEAGRVRIYLNPTSIYDYYRYHLQRCRI